MLHRKKKLTAEVAEEDVAGRSGVVCVEQYGVQICYRSHGGNGCSAERLQRQINFNWRLAQTTLLRLGRLEVTVQGCFRLKAGLVQILQAMACAVTTCATTFRMFGAVW